MKPADIDNKYVTILGAASSGHAAARLLCTRGAHVLLSETRTLTPERRAVLRATGATVESGGHTSKTLEADFMVLSPGVPTQNPIPRAAIQKGIPIYSELEVASWFSQGTMVAITGTNGKTTTTSLIGHVFEQAGYHTVVGGNIGPPLSACVTDTRPGSMLVVEVSSFHLDHIETFKPDVSIVLNIATDHLQRYGGQFARYATSKLRITMNQRGPHSVFIYHYDDPLLRTHAEKVTTDQGLRAVPFSSDSTLSMGAWYVNDTLMVCTRDTVPAMEIKAEDLALVGPHNRHNYMAAAIAGSVLQVDEASLRQNLGTFTGLDHRLEAVAEVDGVWYVNDSKATNVHAVGYALKSYDGPIVLLAGGDARGTDYSSLKSLVAEHVCTLVAFGESAQTIAAELGSHAHGVITAVGLVQATCLARAAAQRGDVVLLSPIGKSFDEFDSYVDRGNAFKAIVHSF